jgi:hypothetical protein
MESMKQGLKRNWQCLHFGFFMQLVSGSYSRMNSADQ